MLLLKNVLFVSGLVKNLFSVLTAHEVNPTSKFISGINSCSLQLHGEEIVKGMSPAGRWLYIIEPVMPEQQIMLLIYINNLHMCAILSVNVILDLTP
jgi:hypothetical protein